VSSTQGGIVVHDDLQISGGRGIVRDGRLVVEGSHEVKGDWGFALRQKNLVKVSNSEAVKRRAQEAEERRQIVESDTSLVDFSKPVVFEKSTL